MQDLKSASNLSVPAMTTLRELYDSPQSFLVKLAIAGIRNPKILIPAEAGAQLLVQSAFYASCVVTSSTNIKLLLPCTQLDVNCMRCSAEVCITVGMQLAEPVRRCTLWGVLT
jgi:hypothetical protein